MVKAEAGRTARPQERARGPRRLVTVEVSMAVAHRCESIGDTDAKSPPEAEWVFTNQTLRPAPPDMGG